MRSILTCSDYLWMRKENPKNGYLSDDGVHLAEKGYDAWAKEVKRFLLRK